MDRHTTIAPAPASLAQVQTISIPSNPTPFPSEPYFPIASSSTMTIEPIPHKEEVASIDVEFNPKDENGNDLFDLDIEEFESKPWRIPGANQSDWFNYGMNEIAWKNYVQKQKRLRQSEIVEVNPFSVSFFLSYLS